MNEHELMEEVKKAIKKLAVRPKDVGGPEGRGTKFIPADNLSACIADIKVIIHNLYNENQELRKELEDLRNRSK